MTHDVWVEVDLSALRHNLLQVRRALADSVKLMAVVKANAYGHGCVETSRAFAESVADGLAVTRLEEALPLREAGLTLPILLFAPIQPENAEAAVRHDLAMTVTGLSLAHTISEAAARLGKTADVHVKVDTGMGRLGLLPAQAAATVQKIAALPNIRVAGVYTHFATAADNLEFARAQLDRFRGVIRSLRDAGVDFGLAHAANSAAILRLPESHLDMVRAGTILYGQYPSGRVPYSLDLRHTWRLKARVCDVRELPAGSPVGYGSEFVTKRPTRTAVIPIGFADGFTLVPEGPFYRRSALAFAAIKLRRSLVVQIRGRKAPVIGRVATQMIVADVTGTAGVEVGDEVIVPAMRIPTSALVPRVYLERSEPPP